MENVALGVRQIYGANIRPLHDVPRSPPNDYSAGCIEGR